MELDEISAEDQQRIDEAVAHDIALLEADWAEMGPPVPDISDDAKLVQRVLEKHFWRLEIELAACALGFVLIAIVALLRR